MPSRSKQQQKFMGMVHALQKGDMKPSDASPELKKVAKSMSDKDVKDFASTSHKGLPKKVKQEIVKKLKELNESVKQSDYISGLKDLQKAVKSEKGSFKGNNGGHIAKSYYENALKMGMDNKFIDNLTRKRINAYNRKAFSLSGGSLHTAVVSGIDLLLKNINEYANKMGRDHLGGDSIPSAKKGGLRDFDGYDNVDYNKDMPMDEVSSSDAYKISRMLGTAQQSTQDFIEDNKIDVKKLESYIKKLSPSKKSIIKDIINGSTDKRLSTIKKGLVKQVRENIDESMMSTLDQIRKDSNSVKDFIKKVLSDRNFRDMKSDKDFIKYLGSIYEAVTEGGIPQNWMSGRTSDYHTKLRGKKRKYDDSNFDKENSGQPDLEESGFDKIEHLKLLNKAMSTMPGSPKQKEIIRQLNKVRKAGGMRPLKEVTKPDFNSKGYKEATKLVSKLRSSIFKKLNDDELEQFRMVIAKSFDLKEYASKQDLSYILDKDSKLDGTPEDKKAIDEIGIFPIDSFVKDLVPGSLVKTTTSKEKERLKSVFKDLRMVLNRFWKLHNIPYRIK